MVAQQKIQQIQDKGACDGAEGTDKKKLLKYMWTQAKLVLTLFSCYLITKGGRVIIVLCR